MELQQILTRDEAAAYLRVPTRTLDRWRAEGKIPCFYIGSRTRFHRRDIEALCSPSLARRPTFGKALAAE
jgi:excisionase family DNA binding protein